jgi:uncharacterized membrane protein
MSILLTLYLAGMPLALVTLIWALWDVPSEDKAEMISPAGFAAALVTVVLWPALFVWYLYQVLAEGSE